uniref:Uncharacterized protein n=1 Tax=viral metagenome TaxID=1070528 RepID=A0A6M3M501_9ZZZZ
MTTKKFTGVNLTTPECILMYPAVFEAKHNELKKKDEWTVTMLFDKKTNDMATLKAAMVQAAKNEFGADVDLKSLDLKRIQDGDKPTSTGKERPAGCLGMWVVKAATRLSQPGVVDKALNKILDPSEIYSGVYAHVNVTVKGYKGPQGNGVTFYLNHVQKIRDGVALTGGPKSEDVFEALDLGENDVDLTADPMADDGMEGMFS